MSLITHEARLLLRQRLSALSLVLLAVLTIAALVAGSATVMRQRAAIDDIPAAHGQDIAAVADYVERTQDAGSAAYYSFHPTWNAPAPLAFAALGMRDVSPFMLRVRALGLEAQIYDGDTFNPELALPGRFDFAFVLVFLAPLFVIALFHEGAGFGTPDGSTLEEEVADGGAFAFRLGVDGAVAVAAGVEAESPQAPVEF